MSPPGHRRTRCGAAWLDALTQRAGMDPDRLVRGRNYVRGNRVSDLEIMPGAIDALVGGSRARPFAVTVSIPVFNDSGWARLLDEVAAEVGHLAALLDGDLPAGLGAELDLRPGPGELHTSCSCPDWTDQPCEHSAAVCYLTADALDADPFALLLLRGRTKDEVLAALRDRRQPVWSAPAGMLATDAYRRALGPLPAPALPPRRPGTPARLPAEPPLASGVSTAELAELATIATRLAWELLCRPAETCAAGGSAGPGSGGPDAHERRHQLRSTGLLALEGRRILAQAGDAGLTSGRPAREPAAREPSARETASAFDEERKR